MKYKDYQRNEKSFNSLTGLSEKQFPEMIPYFEEAHNEYFTEYDMKERCRDNRRSFVICGNGPLPAAEDRLFILSVYLKNNPLREYRAACFGPDQKHRNDFIRVSYRILDDSLRYDSPRDACATPTDDREKLSEIIVVGSEENEELPVLLCDGTEREISRPVDDADRRENSGGKKKKHTIENAVVIATHCAILFTSPSVCGKMHDKKIADVAYSFPHKLCCIK